MHIKGYFMTKNSFVAEVTFNPILLLKVTEFLVKISLFEFLVMTEKTIFVYKLFFVIK